MIAGNLHRDVSDVRLFELGTVFSGTTERVEERPCRGFWARRAVCRSRSVCIPRAPLTSMI
jgi:phenylalanyl-tRNA synthetase beta subunit